MYKKTKCQTAFVSCGLTAGKLWFTVFQSSSNYTKQGIKAGQKYRLDIPDLPLRKTKAEAEADLKVYAAIRGWKMKENESICGYKRMENERKLKMTFKKAERKKAKLRLALCGPSGSGKTFSALLIAKGIGGRVAMIDTERGSGELYAGNPRIGIDYDVMQFGPPFSPERAVAAIKAAKDEGYNVVIFDSLSHVWMGEGGLLEMVDMASKGLQGNSFAAWKNVRPHEKKFLEAIVGTDIHIIATMRTKTAWEITKDEKTGKTKPVKIGLKPEQREGLEYEFTLVLDLSIDGNVATASKDRTSLFVGQAFVPGEQTGQELLTWLNSGADAVPPTPPKEDEAPGTVKDNQSLGAGSNGNNGKSAVGGPPESLLKVMYANLYKLTGNEIQSRNLMNTWLFSQNYPEVTSAHELTKEQAQAITKWAKKEYDKSEASKDIPF
jgi:hypothetical protein